MKIDILCNWLKNLIITIPTSIVQSLIISFLFFILSKILLKIKVIYNYRNNFNFEIPLETEVIKSNEYYFCNNGAEKDKFNQDNNGGIYIFYITIILVPIIRLFIENVEKITIFLKWYGSVPIFISILILFKVSFTNKIQLISIKYIIYSIPISILTLYYGYNLIELSKEMSYKFLTDKFWKSAYIILGIFLAIFQQMITYVIFFRVFTVFLDRKNYSPNWIKKSIYKTKRFESNFIIITMIIVFSGLSYFLTSGILYNWLKK